MAKYLTITEARQHLLNLPVELKNEPVIITKHGKPVMAALSFEQYESLLETLSVLGDRSFAETLQQSIAQAERGETISWKEAKAKLGLRSTSTQ
ncbi:type II toxin-antitoxin system Phd/YefM family antitoxin [Chlorogloeopsis sp. ULAP02]|uniref:type II toxin-antitoxin system Phd/YefM family antitoxin n=1 Tax=Chlorogloeopsis sp. ULAP02 TaxID=3107926 RepID=UPI0031349E80